MTIVSRIAIVLVIADSPSDEIKCNPVLNDGKQSIFNDLVVGMGQIMISRTLENYVPRGLCWEVVNELNRLSAKGTSPRQIAYSLNMLAAERATVQQVRDRVELVWTWQKIAGSDSRDTAVVVRELFNTVKQSVLISSFAIDRGEKTRALFAGLARQMETEPALQVQMFPNIQRPHGNEEPESILLKRFREMFRRDIWLGNRLPEIFYDPRSLAYMPNAL